MGGYCANKFIHGKFNLNDEINLFNTLQLKFDPDYITSIENPTIEQHMIVMKSQYVNVKTYLENLKNIPEELFVQMLSNKKTSYGLKNYLNDNKDNVCFSNYLKWKLLEHNPNFIEVIDDQTEEMALFAVTKDARTLSYIKNKTEDVLLQFIETFGSKQYIEDDSTVRRLEHFQHYFNNITPNIKKRLEKYGYKILKNNKIQFDPHFNSKL